ncbi:MAG: alpha/beta hydrolase [Clostridiales bacterium]|nr:alpha/beta hydrolase [Clostridiales bacterium]
MVYLGTYYHAEDTALKALESNDEVNVTTIEEGYYFDGEGTDSALIFYPGAKVEAESYAPLMMKIAGEGIDCYLCRMPHNLALFGKSMANEIKSDALAGNNTYTGADNNYDKWYIGGHSLGGAAASMLVAEKQDEWAGVIFLASYPTDEIDVPVLSIYGSEDTVLSADNYADAGKDGLWPDDFTEEVIEGGNHAGFGDYGAQKGDGQASITAEEQQALTTEIISRWTELQRSAR